MIPIDTAHIDSLSLSIPKEDITVIDKNLCRRIVTYYYDTDDFDDLLQNPKPLVFQKNGITIRLKWLNLIQPNGTSKEYLNITLSSKLLLGRYFQGITIYNVKYAFFELMSLKVFSCTLDQFLNGQVSDVDICINYNISQESFIRTNQKIISLAKPGFSRYFNWFCKKKRNSDMIINLGLDINSREKAKPSTPYLKHYFKTVELLTKSFDFYDMFLAQELDSKNCSINNLARIEYTIKGHKHKSRLIKRGLLPYSYKTLKELLFVKEENLRKIVYSGFEDYIYIPQRETFTRDVKELSPTDIIMLRFMEKLIHKGYEEIDILEVVSDFETKQKSRSKSKLKKLLKHLRTSNLSVDTQLKNNEEINNFFNKLNNNGTKP